jgi:hypothetical protein
MVEGAVYTTRRCIRVRCRRESHRKGAGNAELVVTVECMMRVAWPLQELSIGSRAAGAAGEKTTRA